MIMKTINDRNVSSFISTFDVLAKKLSRINLSIKQFLTPYADDKVLKGDELVGWLGEIYGKLFYDGILVDDTHEHDFESKELPRCSVKARKGYSNGWNRSGLIRNVKGLNCPTHLMFIHFNDDYSIDRIWVYKWKYLVKSKRLRQKKVRNKDLGWQVFVSDKDDDRFLVLNNRMSS